MCNSRCTSHQPSWRQHKRPKASPQFEPKIQAITSHSDCPRLHHSNMQTLFLPNLAEGADIQQDHVYTFKRAIQEHSSSCQNLAQATDESARPRQQDSKCKLKAIKLLPKPCTGTRTGKTTFTSFNHANPWALAKALLRERMSQQDRVYIVQRHANQELLGSCQTLQRERKSQQDHVHIIQTCKLLGPCQTLLRERRVSKTTTTSFKTCKSRALGLLPNPCKRSE